MSKLYKSQVEVESRFTKYCIVSIIIPAIINFTIIFVYSAKADKNLIYSMLLLRMMPLYITYAIMEKFEELIAVVLLAIQTFITILSTAVIYSRRRKQNKTKKEFGIMEYIVQSRTRKQETRLFKKKIC